MQKQSRRDILVLSAAGVAGIGLAAAASTAKAAEGDDSVIEDLWRKRQAAVAEARAASARYDAAYDTLPEWAKGPTRIRIGWYTDLTKPDPRVEQPVWASLEEHIQTGNACLPTKEERQEWVKQKRAELKELKARVKAERDARDLGRLGKESDSAWNRVWDYDRPIAMAKPTTIRGVLIQAMMLSTFTDAEEGDPESDMTTESILCHRVRGGAGRFLGEETSV